MYVKILYIFKKFIKQQCRVILQFNLTINKVYLENLFNKIRTHHADLLQPNGIPFT